MTQIKAIKPIYFWLLTLSTLTLLWFGSIIPFLHTYPTVAGDDIWILSVSYKWVKTGIFGSELFEGFFNADRHYFINLPLHHLWQALLFKVTGSGIMQARLVSVLMAIALMWVVSGVAYRWYGWQTAVLTALLLLFWRSGLSGIGIPLLAVGRSGRYDVGAVFWCWLAILLLMAWRKRPSPPLALAVGLSCGAATLTQFFGLFTFLLVAVIWVGWHRQHILKNRHTYWLIVGGLLLFIPYLWLINQHWPDFVGQRIITDARLDWVNPSFYAQNIIQEPRRYAHLLTRPGNSAEGYRAISRWWLVWGIGPVIIHLWRRWQQQRHELDGLLLATLAVFTGGLWLWEPIKAPVYAIVLLPSLCLAFATVAIDGVRWLWQPERAVLVRGGGTAVLLLLLAVLLAEGSLTYAFNWQRAQRATDDDRYAAVSERLMAQIPIDGRVIGFEQWWWPLRDHAGYLAWVNLWEQWRWANVYEQQSLSLHALVEQSEADYLIVTRIDPLYIQRYPSALQTQFAAILTTCVTKVDTWQDSEYGALTIYRVQRDTTGHLLCT